MYGTIGKGKLIQFDKPIIINNGLQYIYFFLFYMNYYFENFSSLSLFSHKPSSIWFLFIRKII